MGERAATAITLEAAATQVAPARRFVRRTVEGADPSVVDDLQLIVSELFTNAVEHGASDVIEVVVSQGPDRVSVTVDSRGPTPGVGPAADWRVADRDALSGRGLGIVRELADDLVVERDGDAFIVTATLALRQNADA